MKIVTEKRHGYQRALLAKESLTGSQKVGESKRGEAPLKNPPLPLIEGEGDKGDGVTS